LEVVKEVVVLVVRGLEVNLNCLGLGAVLASDEVVLDFV
jgi:hypothetical protein